MLSIYAVAILSLTNDECRIFFRLSRDYLLSGYQVACKQALLKCTPWRSNDRDCLTALHLYLVSIEQQVDPRSLACMVAVAIRIAQRMGIHCESSYNTSRCTPLEAEMRRRLWWSLVLFDHRICEIIGQEKSTSLTPTWDCRPPLNVNDFEMQPDMKNAPVEHHKSATEAVFTVVRSELADIVRHSMSHLTTIGAKPSPEMVVQSQHKADELEIMERLIEDKRLAHLNPEIPLHYMTIWATRSVVTRIRIMKHYLTHGTSTSTLERLPNAQRSIAYSYAIRMLECDTRLRTSPLTKGYLWLVESWYSPILAYFHILNGLAKRPDEELADKAWRALCDNYEALVNGPKHHRTRLMFAFKLSRITLQTWEARGALLRQHNRLPKPDPRLVLDAKMNVERMSPDDSSVQGSKAGDQFSYLTSDPNMSVSNDTVMPLMLSTSLNIGDQIAGNLADLTPMDFFPNVPIQDAVGISMDELWINKTLR